MRRELMSLAVSVVLLVALTLSLFGVYPAESDYTSRAAVAYRSNTGSGLLNTPKSRDWSGMFWTGEGQLANAGSPVRWVRTAFCPNDTRFYERIVVTLSDDGFLDAYVRKEDKTWSVTTNIGSTGVTVNAYRAFDIAYEKTTGRALLVYSRGAANPELAYRIWNGVSWTSEATYDLPTGANVNWVLLASNPKAGSNEITLVAVAFQVAAAIWSGTAFGNAVTLTNALFVPTEEGAAVAYEQISGRAMVVFGDTNAAPFARHVIWDGTAWGTITSGPDVGAAVNWLTLKADPASNKMMLTSVDAGSDLNTGYWDGSAWTVLEHDAAVDTNAQRCADFEWEPSGSKGLLIWGDSNTDPITYKTFVTSPAPVWGAISTYTASGVTDQEWVQMRVDPRGVGSAKIYIGVIDDDTTPDITLLYWDGAAFGGLIEITAAAVYTYECFEIEFQPVWKRTPRLFVDPATQSVSGNFDVRVNITGAYSLYSWEFNMTYDTTKITAINVTVDTALLSLGGTFFYNKTINDANGWVYAYCSLQGNVPGVTGDGTLATIKFVPQAAGTSSLDLHDTKLVEYDFVSQTNTLYPPNKHNEVDGSVTVSVLLVGDLNHDGWVDGIDLALLNLAFGSEPGDPNWNSEADLNPDSLIDVYDLRLQGKGWYPPP